MSEFHLDALVDADIEGRLDAAGRVRLQAHQRSCSICQLESCIRQGGEREPGDEARLAVIFESLDLSSVDIATPARTGETRTRSRLLGMRLAVAAVLVAVTSVTAFASVQWVIARVARESPTIIHEPPDVLRKRTQKPQRDRPTPTLVAPLPDRAPPTVTRPARHHAVFDGAETFKKANQARRNGHHAEAVRLYRRLLRKEGGSSRAQIARMSLGDLLLTKFGDSRGALRQFDAYLKRQPRGSLAEEAVVGRARALSRLGRQKEERAAWRLLLRRYPDSLHAARAIQRLEQIGDGDPR